MRLFEFTDSDEEILGIIKPIILRAKAEGAQEISMSQLLNDLDSRDEITPELMVDILRRHRTQMKNIVAQATTASISLNTGPANSMNTAQNKTDDKVKNTALQQALDNLK